MELVVRQAQSSDLAMLVNWGQALHEVERSFEPQLQFDANQALTRYHHELHNPNAMLLVAEHVAQGVGYLYARLELTPDYFHVQARECVIEVIYLEPEWRRKGAGSLLVKQCSLWAHQQNVWRFAAGIYAANEASTQMFMRLGFHPYHTTFVKGGQET